MIIGSHLYLPPLGAGYSPETLAETWRSDSVVLGGGDFSASTCSFPLAQKRTQNVNRWAGSLSTAKCFVFSALPSAFNLAAQMGHPCGSSSVGGSCAPPNRADLGEEESQGSSSYSNWLSPVGFSPEKAGGLSGNPWKRDRE